MNRMTFALLGAALIAAVTPSARARQDASAAARAERMAMIGAADAGRNAVVLPQQQQEVAQADRERAQDEREAQQDAREQARDARESAKDKYESALDAVDDSRWEEARQEFDQIARDAASNADAALYWRAYCEDKLGRRSDALASIADLEHKYPQSRWQNDAKALDLQVHNETGQPVSPQSQSDEELKLLAINSLMQSDSSEALPLLEKVLNGTGTPRLKERALFVLAQNGTPQASDILLRIAQGNSNPQLQRKAIQYLGLFGGSNGQAALARIYASTNDGDVKREILRSFMVSGDRDRLYALAQNEKDPDLQREAVQMLGVSGARDDLWKLYQTNPPDEVREGILRAMFVAGDADHLEQLAKAEKNPDLRIEAIRNMGLIGSDRTGATLVSMYAGAKDTATSRAVLRALFLQGNAQAIVDIARKETDPELKKDAVQQLSLMHSKVATDYLLEILNK